MKKKSLEKTLKSLANRRRLAMLAYLKNVDMASISTISKEINLAFKTASRNLVILERAGIVTKQWQNSRIIYQLAKTPPKFVEHPLAEL